MNREEIGEKIAAIPAFQFREVAVKNNEDKAMEELQLWVPKSPIWRAVTETENTTPLAFVSRRYELVQFKTVFQPLVDQIPGAMDANLLYANGYAILDIFPNGEEYQYGPDQIGISAHNSVDKTSAVSIRFVVRTAGRLLSVPKNIASFRSVHIGDIGARTHNYVQMLTSVRTAWTDIVGRFTQVVVTKEDIGDYATSFGMDQKFTDEMKEKLDAGEQWNLWEVCMAVYDYIVGKTFKSEVNQRRRLDEFCECIFTYQFATKLGA